MATHDYDIANQSGANFRTDLNNCLDAIVSNNSNASDPSTTFAYMWWVDTSNNVLKLRNSANNAWITLPMSITASNTITPTLNMGTGAEEDVKIVFDGNAQDFYIALDDSADDLLIGKGSTVGTTPAIAIDENLLTTLHGGLTMVGTTPTLTIGDGDEEDTKIVFDGNAQDYYIGLDDTYDSLFIGKGSTVGTTPAIGINENQHICINGATFGTSGGGTNYGSLTVNGSLGGILDFTDDGILQTFIASLDGSFQLLHMPNEPALFGVNNAECFRIIAGNTLGVGTSTSDSHKMAIDSGSGTSLGLMHKSSNAFTLMTFKASGTSQDIRLGATGNDMIFQTNGTERMRIDASGRLLFGTTTVNIDGASGTGVVLRDNNSSLFTVDGDDVMALNRLGTDGTILRFRNDGTSVGYIATGSNSLPSDRNFKKDIEDLKIGLNLIKKLKPTQYNYKIQDENAPKLYGLIAQDLEQSLIEVGVEKNSTTLLQHEPDDDEKESDYKLDYLKLTPVLINAIQEQQEQIEALQSEINTLKGE